MLLGALSKVKIFEGLCQDELAKIASICREVKFEEGDLILHESDKGDELYLLLEGRVCIEMEMPLELGWGKLTTIQEGEIFGEISFISGLRRSATARSLNRTRVAVIGREPLNRLLEQNAPMGYVVMRHLAEVLCKRLDSTDLMWRNAVWNAREFVSKV